MQEADTLLLGRKTWQSDDAGMTQAWTYDIFGRMVGRTDSKLGGGEIILRAVSDGACLCVEVVDDGMGLAENAASGGAGLANIRARLAALFGDAGSLALSGNADGGVTATLILPCQENSR